MSASRREQILREAATLSTGDDEAYRSMCARQWLENPEDEVESDELPILDAITQMYVRRDDVVKLSDGHCYSRDGIRGLVASGVVDDRSGRPRLPLTQAVMQLSDYDAVELPRPTDADADAGRLRNVQTQAASYVEPANTDTNAAPVRRSLLFDDVDDDDDDDDYL